jgi:HD-GYP domain-containing protein (c-di-GMP phosphodiesterase class II)
MHPLLRNLSSRFDLNETFTRTDRHQVTLRYAIWFTIFVLLTLLPFLAVHWSREPEPWNAFYALNNIACILGLVATSILNDKNKSNLAGEFFIFISSYLCFTAYPFQNPDQILLYLTIPVCVSSFISDGRRSLGVVLIVIPMFLLVFLLKFSQTPFPIFSVICVVLLALISWRVSVLIDKIIGQIVNAYDSTIAGWAQALELRNQETEGHSLRVVELTMQLAKKMRLPAERLDHFRRGVLLHDIGKMGIPDSILCKPGPLTDAEKRVMQKHPEYARDLIKPISYLSPAADIPYCHHEKWDGTGYPRGIQGDAIPIEARIFSVVDVWDAMRSKRSYRPAIPETQVVEYLRTEKGRSFDPKIVDEFLNLLQIPELPSKKNSRLVLSYPPRRLQR